MLVAEYLKLDMAWFFNKFFHQKTIITKAGFTFGRRNRKVFSNFGIVPKSNLNYKE